MEHNTHEDMVRRMFSDHRKLTTVAYSTDHIFMSIVFHPLIRDTYYHSRHIHTSHPLCIVVCHESVYGGRNVSSQFYLEEVRPLKSRDGMSRLVNKVDNEVMSNIAKFYFIRGCGWFKTTIVASFFQLRVFPPAETEKSIIN